MAIMARMFPVLLRGHPLGRDTTDFFGETNQLGRTGGNETVFRVEMHLP